MKKERRVLRDAANCSFVAVIVKQTCRSVLGSSICCCSKLIRVHLIPVSATPCSQGVTRVQSSVTHGIGSVTDIPERSNGFNSKDEAAVQAIS